VFWLPTEPPFQTIRDRSERQALLLQRTARARWVLSGSVSGWGDVAIERFDLVVFLTAPTEVRLDRLRARERAQFGHAAIAPGGAMHANYEAFIAWAAKYDTGGTDMRSRALHEAWLATLPCAVLRLDGLLPTAEQVERVVAQLVSASSRQ
jgi:hypothetical protein